MIFRTFYLPFLLLLIPLCLDAQKAPDMYVVELTDKEHSSYTIHEPWAFLSARSIMRRKKSGIAITESDLPVNENYIQAIKNIGVGIHSTSKWMNSVLIIISSKKQLDEINNLPFVEETFPVGKFKKAKKTNLPSSIKKVNYTPLDDRYGHASVQIRMLLGHIIHMLGHEGEGILVGVLDGGFTNTDVMPFFDSLRIDGRLLPSKDVVHRDDYAYEHSQHGSQVLSTMAANLPGLMVGTAPDADYACIKTEEMGAENPVEEEYWIRGLEYADSLGVDVINSSLGYTTFDLKDLNHKKSELDGQTYRASRAATIAASKGILVVSSAGNEGNGQWKKVGVPADAEDILTIGAVNIQGERARFSSFGPSTDGRIKPDVASLGQRSAVAHKSKYQVYAANGTSFSSPIMAGMAASLWSAFPSRNYSEIKESIIAAGSQSMSPDTLIGYGIPDFTKAYAYLSGVPTFHSFELGTRIFKNKNGLQILFPRTREETWAKCIVYDMMGKVVLQQSQQLTLPLGLVHIQNYEALPNSIYQIIILTKKEIIRVHDIKTTSQS